MRERPQFGVHSFEQWPEPQFACCPELVIRMRNWERSPVKHFGYEVATYLSYRNAASSQQDLG